MEPILFIDQVRAVTQLNSNRESKIIDSIIDTCKNCILAKAKIGSNSCWINTEPQDFENQKQYSLRALLIKELELLGFKYNKTMTVAYVPRSFDFKKGTTDIINTGYFSMWFDWSPQGFETNTNEI